MRRAIDINSQGAGSSSSALNSFIFTVSGKLNDVQSFHLQLLPYAARCGWMFNIFGGHIIRCCSFVSAAVFHLKLFGHRFPSSSITAKAQRSFREELIIALLTRDQEIMTGIEA
jgi:hypothetical protein